ncbi:VCBS repeat-containing protein, partial [candidate division WOR-3 bacterium]|nr:VCBS repeat-containing protein [candidate division WOR-3 bacterium]
MHLLFCLLLTIPYPTQPDWESVDDDYSTGGALVDIDLDGDIDFVTGNGNDMEQEPNRVYYNIADSLERTASWSSTDIGYNAHISVGDIDYDGYPDLAVANYGDPATPQYDKLYYNLSGTFGSTFAWQPSDLDNSFACALGDVDGDGDLDLAVACGEEYTDSLQHAKVYLNNNGLIDTIPTWQTNIESYFYDVVWVDIDKDGDLDLALAGHHRQNMIYLNSDGMLQNNP